MTACLSVNCASRWRCWLVLIFSFLIAGCAGIPSSTTLNDTQKPAWNGRLAIKVEDQPSQSFSTGFALKGNAQTGELNLLSPLGSTLARLTWNPDKASLRTSGNTQEFSSLEALMVSATGTAIPVAALFDWLVGTATPIEGWLVDLSRQPEGRLLARRAAPATELRVVLDPP